MRLNSPLAGILIILVAMFSCIEPFTPDLGESATDKYVVYGQLTNEEGYQYVKISLSSKVDEPAFIPLRSCRVDILDDKGHTYGMNESEAGIYRIWMSSSDLKPGTSYQIRVVTPSGVEIVSDFDQMPVSPPVDSLWYTVEEGPPDNPARDLPGIQFHLDLDAGGTGSHYFRWELTETWERHATYPKIWWYDGRIHQTDPPDYSLFICYNTEQIKNIYTLSTANLAANRYQAFQLNYVGNNSSRLAIMYSLLVRQYAMSRAAYEYWDQLRVNSNNQGGLYEKQPIRVRGNLEVVNAPGKEVLGTFNAVSVQEKRIFVNDVPGLELDYESLCHPPYILDRGGLEASRGADRILYFLILHGAIRPIDAACVDCTKLGGTTEKPDYWPE